MQPPSKLGSTNSSSRVYATCLLWLLVVLFVHPFTAGYNTSLAIGFITSVCVGLCVLLCSASTAQTPARQQHAACVFLAIAVVIAFRQGPLPLTIWGTVSTLVIMAAWAVCVGLFRQSKQHFNALMAALVIAALLNALIALYQYFGWSMTHPLPFIKPAEAGNALGQVNQRNLLAFLSVLGVTIIILVEEWQTNKWLCWALSTVGVLLTASAAATASRSGALSFIALSMMVFFSRRYLSVFTRRLALSFALLYIGFSFLLPWLSEVNSVFARFADGEGGCHSRMILWSNATTMIQAAPWFGHGWGSFLSTFYTTSFEQRFCEIPDHAHNLFLQLSAELGVPVAVAVAGYCLWLFVSQRQALCGSTPRKLGYCIVVLSLIYSQTEYPLWNVDFLAVFSLALGLLFAPDTFHRASPAAPANAGNRSPVMVMMSIFGALVALAGAFGHYQYSRVSQLDIPAGMRDLDLRADPQSTLNRYWMFSNQLMYVRIHNVQISPNNAKLVSEEGLALLKYAPAPTVIIKVIDSAKLLGNQDLEAFHTQRLKEIYPLRYNKWKNSLAN